MDNKELDNLKKNITLSMKGESVDGTLGYVLEETDFENVAEIIVNLLPIHDVSCCDNDTKDLIEHTKRVIDLIRDKSGIAVKVLGNRVNKKLEQLNSCG